MTNIRLPSIDQYQDVQSVNNYNQFFTKETEEKRMERICAHPATPPVRRCSGTVRIMGGLPQGNRGFM